MYNYNQVISGIAKYVDTEIVNKIVGWKKWVVGSGLGIMLSSMTNVFNQIKTNEFVKMMGIIDENDNIDVEKIYVEMKNQAAKGPITFDIPMLGPVTLSEQDLDTMYRLIKNEQ